MGGDGEGLNITHQQKKMGGKDFAYVPPRTFQLPIYRYAQLKGKCRSTSRRRNDAPEMQYHEAAACSLGGLPAGSAEVNEGKTCRFAAAQQAPGLLEQQAANAKISTTMAFRGRSWQGP